MAPKVTKTKKEKILQNEPQSKKGLIVIVAVGLVLAAGLGFYFADQPSQTAKTDPHSSGITTTAQAVSFPVGMFDDGQARHYDHKTGEITVRYFILKSSDGVIRAAFDACDVCWPAGKGYEQQGDVMVCRNCGRQFASVNINEVKGGCNPAPLERNLEGDKLVIRTADIEKGRTYFDFKGKV